MQNILDMQCERLTVIVGTFYKEQKKKPCVFDNITSCIKATDAGECSFGNEHLRGKFTSEDDFAVLEDSSGRV